MKQVIPTSAEQLEAMLADAGRMKDVLRDPASFKEFIENYAAASMDRDSTIAQQVKEQTQSVLAEWLKETRERDGAVPVDLSTVRNVNGPRASKYGLYNPHALGASIDNLPYAKDAAGYFRTIWHNTHADNAVQEARKTLRNAFAEKVPSEGGFLVPETLRSDLLRVALETAVVRSRARIVPMETLRVPYPAIDDTSHTSSVYGGIVGAWTAEGGALSTSQASFGRTVLEAKKLTAYTEVPNELLSDSVASFTQFINEIFPEALSFYEDDAFINGTGVGEPLGVQNADCAVSVTRAGAGKVQFADIVAMYPRMLPVGLGRAVWIASIDVMPQLMQLVLISGTTPVAPPLWLNGMQAIGAPALSLLGRPVIFTEKSPALGNAGDLMFVDLSFYLIGDRQAMSATSSEHFKFANDVTSFRIIERVDGRPWLNSSITPKNGGAALSPVVKLV